MAVTDNVLIVEDEPDWCAIYRDVALAQGIATVRTTHDLAGAEAMLSEMKFGVAFVDIGLDVDDDRNIDGLRVLERIRALGDETAVIVVTGRSGKDVLPITRDAIKKYEAFDAVAKVPLEPADIARLLAEGLEAYRTATQGRGDAAAVLRGRREMWNWEHEMLQAIPVPGGARGLHGLLERLLERFGPLLSTVDGAAMALDPDARVAHGAYWSRAAGSALLALVGPVAAVDACSKDAEAGRPVLGAHTAGSQLHAVTSGQARGAVFALPGRTRPEFA